MKKKGLFLIVLLLSGLSCATPSIVIPKIQYKSTTQLHNEQPDCRADINTALDYPNSKNVLEAFFCYDTTIQYWENEYQLLQLQLDSLYREMEETK